MGSALAAQLGAHPRAMYMAGGVLGAFGLIPGLPKIPFILLGAGIATVGRMAAEAERTRMQKEAAARVAEAPAAPAADPMSDLLQLDPIELEVGYALIPLVDEKQGGDLLERISMLRKQSAQELGILVPAIRIRDDIRLPANEYVIKLRGAEIARGEVMPRFLLALDTGRVIGNVEGIDTIDPSFGMPARWIAVTKRVEAESLGYVVVEPATVVATHLMEKLKSSAADLLGRQDVQEMVDTLKKTHPALVDDVIPGKISLGVLHRVLQRLLKERVPIRDLVTIMEAVADAADQTKDPEVLTEHARRALTNTIARLHMDETGVVRGITIGPKLEMSLVGLFTPRPNQSVNTMLTPDTLGALLRELDQMSSATMVEGRPLPLLAPPSLRVGLRRLIEPVLPNLPVVSLAELPPYVKLSAVATWETSHAA
jgi:flagellar biosynthesis protein FlhA